MSTRFTNKWLVLCIDLGTVAISFFLAYLIRFNFNLNFDVSKFLMQLPVVLLITLMAFLVTGFYKEVFRNTVGDTGKIFKALGLSSVLLILLVLVSKTWDIFPVLSIPLSIIIIFCLLALFGLTTSRYLIKVQFNTPV